MEVIIITFKNNEWDKWNKEQWDDYFYEDHFFVVKKNGAWVGIYNMSEIRSIVVQ